MSTEHRNDNSQDQANVIIQDEEPAPTLSSSKFPDRAILPSKSFDLSPYRLTQNFSSQMMLRQPLVVVPVRKPYRQSFIFVHPSDEYSADVCILELKEEGEHYLMSPEIALLYPGECNSYTLFVYAIRGGGFALWPIRLPGEDGRDNHWWQSAREAATIYNEQWIRVFSNKSLGAYDVFVAEGELEPPRWPEKSFEELVEVAFKDKIIKVHDHPVLRRLRGEV